MVILHLTAWMSIIRNDEQSLVNLAGEIACEYETYTGTLGILKKKLGEIDSIIYTLCIAALAVIAAAVLLYLFTGFSVLQIKYPCLFYNLTGLYCPGCGGVRSVKALLRGDIWQSFIDYPPTLYGIAVLGEFTVRCFLRKHFKGNFGPERDGAILPFIYVGLGLAVLQWIVKLVAQIGFGYTWIR